MFGSIEFVGGMSNRNISSKYLLFHQSSAELLVRAPLRLVDVKKLPNKWTKLAVDLGLQ